LAGKPRLWRVNFRGNKKKRAVGSNSLKANQPGQVIARPIFLYTHAPEIMCLKKTKVGLLLQVGKPEIKQGCRRGSNKSDSPDESSPVLDIYTYPSEVKFLKKTLNSTRSEPVPVLISVYFFDELM
jgi:hypothetical protein